MSDQDIAYVRVHPGIGLARVGNSPDYFIGPEAPGVVPDPGDGLYKDGNGRIKRQAARFRVYGYNAAGDVVKEITSDDATIEWEVRVANKKAAFFAFQGKYGFDPKQLRNSTVAAADRGKLIIDPGPKKISGPDAAAVELDGGSAFKGLPPGELSGLLAYSTDSAREPRDRKKPVKVTYTGVDVSLGRLETDAKGRLIFVGGAGLADSTSTPKVVITKVPPLDGKISPNPEYNGNSYFNNPTWFDDTCGGSINVKVTLKGGTVLTTNDDADKRGWVAVAPPKYGPQMNNVVSLLDLQLSLFPAQDPYTGAGPVALAAGSETNAAVLSSSSTGTAFPALAGAAGGAVFFGPALAFFNGKLAYASAFDPKPGTPTREPGISVGEVGKLRPLAPAGKQSGLAGGPALAVFNGRLFYAAVAGASGKTPMIAASASAAPDTFEFRPAAGAAPPEVGTGPGNGVALSAFDGQLFCAVAVGGTLNLAASDTGAPGSFAFERVGSAGNVAATPPALTTFRSRLVFAYGDKDGSVYLATSLVPLNAALLTYASLGAAGQTRFMKVTNAPASPSGIALSAFNGRLYLAVTAGKKVSIASIGADALQAAMQSQSSGVTFGEFAVVAGPPTDYAPALATHEPVSFYRDIYPIFKTVTDYSWTNQFAFTGHAPGSRGDLLQPEFLAHLADPTQQPDDEDKKTTGPSERRFVFNLIRPIELVEGAEPPAPPKPAGTPPTFAKNYEPSSRLMPRLFGTGGSPLENNVNGTTFPNQWLTLTPHQLGKFQRWVNGDFVEGEKAPLVPIDEIPVDDQPAALDFSALEPTVGGGFHPGIEITYIMNEPSFFEGAFRIAARLDDGSTVEPGDIASYMSVPWQGDFWSCNTSWWPAQRPDIVVRQGPPTPGAPNLFPVEWFRGTIGGKEIPKDASSLDGYQDGYDIMARYWPYFGFVVAAKGQTAGGQQVYHEVERDSKALGGK